MQAHEDMVATRADLIETWATRTPTDDELAGDDAAVVAYRVAQLPLEELQVIIHPGTSSKATLAHAGWAGLGYALSQVLPDAPPPASMLTDDEARTYLMALVYGTKAGLPMAALPALPWGQIAAWLAAKFGPVILQWIMEQATKPAAPSTPAPLPVPVPLPVPGGW